VEHDKQMIIVMPNMCHGCIFCTYRFEENDQDYYQCQLFDEIIEDVTKKQCKFTTIKLDE
jgi:MinD superfamily P-loop ATPase